MQQSHQKPLLFSPTLSRGRSVILLGFLHNYELWIQIFRNSFEILSQKHSCFCSCRVRPRGQRGWESEVLFLVKLCLKFFLIQKYTEGKMACDFKALSVSALRKRLTIISVCLLPSANPRQQYLIQVQRCCEASFITVCLKVPDILKQNWLWKSEALQFVI